MKRLTIALIALACPLSGIAAEAFLSLEEAVSIAIERAPEVAARDAARTAASSMSQSAGRLPDPTALIGIDNVPTNGPEAWSTSRDFMTMRKIGVMQEFPAAASRRAERQRFQADVDVADAELASTRLDVAREAASAWIRRATTLDALRALRALQEDFELGAVATRGALRSGESSAVDALEAESALAKLRSRLLELEGSAQEAEVALARWIGDDASLPMGAIPSFDTLPAPAGVLRENAHLHASVLPHDLRIEAARTDVALARAAKRPDWSVELSFGKRGRDFSDMAALQFRVSLPLFGRNRQNPIIAARSAEVRQAQFERDAELRMHQAELDQVLVIWRRLGAQLEQFEAELVPLARERSRAALAAYRSGLAPLRSAIEAFEDESEILVERAMLVRDRGAAWAYLRYLEVGSLNGVTTP